MRTRNSGITLVELLIVIAIISVLAGLLFPVFASAKRSAYGSQCISNLNQLTVATLLYSGDSEDVLPYGADPIVKSEIADAPTCFTDDQKSTLAAMPSLKDLLAKYGASPTQWQCPLDEIDPVHGVADGRNMPSWYAQDGSSYVFDDIEALSSPTLSSVGDTSSHLLASDEEAFHGGGDHTDPQSIAAEGRVNCAFFDGHTKSASVATVGAYVKAEGCWF